MTGNTKGTSMAKDKSVQSAHDQLVAILTPRQIGKALRVLMANSNEDGPKPMAPAMVWGPPGIGKTEILRAIFKGWSYRTVALHLAQYDPTDLKGIPIKTDDGRVIWVPSSYLPQQESRIIDSDVREVRFKFHYATGVEVLVQDKDGEVVYRGGNPVAGDVNLLDGRTINFRIWDPRKGVEFERFDSSLHGYTVTVAEKAGLFLDELSAAPVEVQNAALQLVQDRRIAEYDVPMDTPIVCAGNRAGLDSNAVFELTPPLMNRLCHYRMRVNAREWIEDFALSNGIRPEVIGYIARTGDKALMEFNPDTLNEGDCGFPTPRSITNMSRQLCSAYDGDPEMAPIQAATVAGWIGTTRAADFLAFRKNCQGLHDTDEILAGKPMSKLEMGPGERFFMATALCGKTRDLFVELGIHEGMMANQTYPDRWKVASGALCKYLDSHLGKEMAVMCIHTLVQKMTPQISMAYFKGNENFEWFAREYKTLITKLGR